ncbi:hypothetical protein, partial [Klebsiella pneumoniae]|uniref:hypothetical protein n=1 Tax=Klebsiella pneumoniae TaxID=573 RepID=UPI0027E57E38
TATLGHFTLKLQLSDTPPKFVNHKFHVIDKIHLPHDGIIGSDALNALGGNINYVTKEIRFNKIPYPLKFDEPVYSIPARSEM